MSNEICCIEGCENAAERSLNKKKFEGTSFVLKDDSCRQVHLCKEHYRAWKKETKNSIADYIGTD